MNHLKQALMELLSGLTTKKNDKEIWTKGQYGSPITVEIVDAEKEKYIARRYWENGNKRLEIYFKNDQQHGKSMYWRENGSKFWESDYQNDELHGKYIVWNEDGNKLCEREYQDGLLVETVV